MKKAAKPAAKVYVYDRSKFPSTVKTDSKINSSLDNIEKYSRMSLAQLICARMRTSDIKELQIIAHYVRQASK